MRLYEVSQKGTSSINRLKKVAALKRVAAVVTALALSLILPSCALSGKNAANSMADEKTANIIGDFQYPENPPEQLRNVLANDFNERRLPLEISDVKRIVFDSKECAQITIAFSNSKENMCVILFTNKYLDYNYEESLDGRDNPSFTMAFKDPDNSQDMITVLTSVIKSLSPDLSLGEAERLATKQDETISTDGYSMPKDIGGYQIQTRYTNPYVSFRSPDFEAKLGIKVTALKQIWGALDTQPYKELKAPEDHNEESKNSKYMYTDFYADFIVKNVWQHQSYLHGETYEIIDAESLTGQPYTLILDTWVPSPTYEFGVGQQYTFYISQKSSYGKILYAVQRSESAQFNSHGEAQPIDSPADDWRNPVVRIEPEEKGPVYDVYFELKSQTYGEKYAALEGHGIGEKQWPDTPIWENYTFIGWYDNLDWNGKPYSQNTPIYQDTHLYAKWKYSGSGGIWPRAHRGNIQGLVDGSHLAVKQKLTITASGYNMNLESPKDQRFRWRPVTWRLSDGTRGSFSSEAPFQATLSLNSQGEQRLFISYTEEIFDGIEWQKTGQLREVDERMFWID